MISPDRYRDNNNFIPHSEIWYKNTRFYESKMQVERCFNIRQMPVWYQDHPRYSKINRTIDGQNYNETRLHLLAGTYFYLSNKVDVTERQLFSYVELMEQLGGLLGLIASILKFVIEPIKLNCDIAKTIQIIYFKKKNRHLSNGINIVENQEDIHSNVRVQQTNHKGDNGNYSVQKSVYLDQEYDY